MMFYQLCLAHAQQLKQLLHKPPLWKWEKDALNITLNIWIIETFGIGLIHSTNVELINQAFINQGAYH